MKLKKGDKVRRCSDNAVGIVLRVYGLYAKVSFGNQSQTHPINTLEKVNPEITYKLMREAE
jgi:hypothetical protein